MFIHKKKSAIELSVGTIIILVLGVTMLILGMVLIRSIMCSTIDLTKGINEKVESELNRYFGSTGSEVACIGSTGEPVRITAGRTNIISCAIKAPEQAKYTITAKNYESFSSALTKEEIKKWAISSTWSNTVPPGDQSPRKILTLKVPNNAPEGNIRIQLEVQRDNTLIATPDLDFQIGRTGFIKSVVC